MLNWVKQFFCKQPKHVPLLRYSGICKLGYVCKYCGYEWYENRVRTKPNLKSVSSKYTQRFMGKLFPSKLMQKLTTDFIAVDKLIIETTVNFSLLDRIKILATGKVEIRTETSTENVIGESKTSSISYVSW